ncbi:hypothetical protein KsCSTR_34000 [Candidatus Kuenenia stuttgartiensis]|uniref:Uncharacterized protein n=1 Tax=Kuenenia stuttgartiensis TaxID=174633 RepID=A0A6G7GT43_KUEST|nr:hypothetical protein KsCSTR_34000 [Candidatus Kuenenia stuttgartiensis]
MTLKIPCFAGHYKLSWHNQNQTITKYETNSNDKKTNATNFTETSSNQCLTIMHFEKLALKTRS